MVPFRDGHKGWMIQPYHRRLYVPTQTDLDLDEEAWLVLRGPSEVSEAGRRLFQKLHPDGENLQEPKLSYLWQEFRGYVRQAEAFYRGAKVLPWKSSPLNYYYAFLNLAKAYCLVSGRLAAQALKEPRIIRHGLSARVEPGSPDRWQVAVVGNEEVFSLLYLARFGIPIPTISLDIHRLLGYSPAISWQMSETGHANALAYHHCYWALFFGDQTYWDVIGIPGETDLTPLEDSFYLAYEEISTDSFKEMALKVFSLHASEAKRFRFFQRRQPEVSVEGNQWSRGMFLSKLEEALPNAVDEDLAGQNGQMNLSLPYVVGGERYPMDELLASYVVMFFLSNLVRYHPNYMDHIAETSDAWLIESFAKSAPIALLRHFVTRILGYTLVMTRA